MTQFSAGSGSESAMARQFAKELDSARGSDVFF